MKKIVSLILAAALSAVLLVGCGSSDSGTTATPSSSGSNTSDDTTVYTFRIDDPNPETATCSKILDLWSDWVSEASDGRLQMEVFHNAQLGNIADCVTNCVAGISDGFWSTRIVYSGVFPVGSGIGLPMMGIRNCEVGTAACMEILETTDYFYNEYQGQGLYPLVIHTSSTYPIGLSNGKTYADGEFQFSDFSGLKIRAGSSEMSAWATNLGTTPVSISSNEGYENLEKGVINSYIFDWDKIGTSRLLEVTDCILDCQNSVSPMLFCLNLEKYEALPDDLKEILADSADFFISQLKDGYQTWIDQDILDAEAAGVPIVSLSDETLAAMSAAAEPVWQSWIESMNSKGYDGQAIFDLYCQLIEKYNAIYDYDA